MSLQEMHLSAPHSFHLICTDLIRTALISSYPYTPHHTPPPLHQLHTPSHTSTHHYTTSTPHYTTSTPLYYTNIRTGYLSLSTKPQNIHENRKSTPLNT